MEARCRKDGSLLSTDEFYFSDYKKWDESDDVSRARKPLKQVTAADKY
jgi:hypothetical protein